MKKKSRKRKSPKTISKMKRSLGVTIDKFILGQYEIDDKYMALEEK